MRLFNGADAAHLLERIEDMLEAFQLKNKKRSWSS
jgi:hypothetical protein